MKIHLIIGFIFSWLLVGLSTYAADDQPIHITEKQWEAATKKIDYTENYKEIKQKEKPVRKASNMNFMALITVVVYLLLAALVILLIVWLVRSNFIFNKKVTPIDFSIDHPELEKHIFNLDLNDLLKRSLAYNDFRSAIRITYLQLIKLLNEENLIKWSAEKTNGEYLRELSKFTYRSDISQLTLGYELAWFGDHNVLENDYHRFENFYQKLQHKIVNREK